MFSLNVTDAGRFSSVTAYDRLYGRRGGSPVKIRIKERLPLCEEGELFSTILISGKKGAALDCLLQLIDNRPGVLVYFCAQ